MWYYAKESCRQGPVDEITLRELIRQGVITSQTLVWTVGMEQWRPAGQTPLFEPPASPAPPHPAPPPADQEANGRVLAQIALTCSILGVLGIFCCGTAPLSIVGVILAHINLANRSTSTAARQLSRAALVLGYLTILIYLAGVIFFFLLGQGLFILDWLKNARPGWPI